MFNVSLKISNADLIEINNLMQNLLPSYTDYLFEKSEKDKEVKYSNIRHFSIKVASVLFNHEHLPSNKLYSFSFNINCWIGFREFYFWASVHHNIDNNPHFSTLYRELKTQADLQIQIKSGVSNLNSGLMKHLLN